MRDALLRVLGALGASLTGALLAGALSGALRAPADRAGGAVREAALFAPLAALFALALAPVALVLSPARRAAIARVVTATEARARSLATLALLVPPAAVLYIALAARAGQFFITAFHHVGLAALAQAVALTALGALVAVPTWALRRAVGRALPGRVASVPVLVAALVAGAALAGMLVALGLSTGDLQGRGGLLGAYGVLRKPELDLAPVYGLLGAFALALALAHVTTRALRLGLALFVLSVPAAAGLLAHVARHYGDAPSAAVIDARPGLARTVLRVLRKRTDRDHDGFSALFGGGDCDDRNAAVNPNARDVPGNGLDEDCSGTDAPRALPPPAPPPPSLGERLRRETPADMNLVLITVDTLRWDLHYAGNPRPLSENLDRLATQSVVFDHAYALSSYTGRAVAPLLAGRYPTECARDGEHFTSYGAANVLLAERLQGAGFRTQGCASHFYFERHFGLAQGMEVWDLSAKPSSDEQETTSNDARVADRALALLNAPENRDHRFLLWVHFFDPHKQYVPHPEFASFGSGERAHYDGEVAWTDRQVGRLLAALDAQPFAARTVVAVTADHGEAFGEHGMGWHGVELWDELVRVPLLLRVPGVAPHHVSVPRSQIDLVPTLLDLLRVPPPAADAADALSGVSLAPDLLNEPAPARPIYIELPEGPFNSLRRSVVYDGWKLTERGARRFELYHLADDPAERHDLAATNPADLARMRALLEQVRGALHPVPASGEGTHER